MVEALKYYELTIQLLQQAINADPDPLSRAVTTDKLNQYQDRKVQLKRDILKAGLPLPQPARPLPDPAGNSSSSNNNNSSSTSSASTTTESSVSHGGTLQRGASVPAMVPVGLTSAAPYGNGASSSEWALVRSTTGVVYFVGNKLGGGNFGVVHDCKDAFERDFVVKQIRPNRKKEELEAEWAKEVQFLFSLNHPNIVRLYDAFQYEDRYYMVMERCAGSVRDFVKRHGPMDGPRVIDAAGQLLSGLNHIHSRDIIHRDLHIDNVLYAESVGTNVLIKISDFGISKLLKNGQAAAKTFIGRDYDYCFREDDHQILTNSGFKFLDEIEAMVELDGDGCVVNWHGLQVANYDEHAQQLFYKTPRALIVNEARAGATVLEFRERGDGRDCSGLIELGVTAEHMMYASVDGAPFEKVSAGELAASAKSGSAIEFCVSAANGIGGTSVVDNDTGEYDGPWLGEFGELGLKNNEQVTAFLELYGWWVGSERSGASESQVTLCVRNRTFVVDRVLKLGWTDSSVDETGDDVVNVCEADVVRVFAREYQARYAPTLGGEKWLFRWVLSKLTRRGARSVLRGLCAAAGDGANVIYTASVHIRDEAVRLCLNSGFVSHVEQKTNDARFAVRFGERRTTKSVDVNEVALSTRSWCFDMENGFVVVRHARRVRADVWLRADECAKDVALLEQLAGVSKEELVHIATLRDVVCRRVMESGERRLADKLAAFGGASDAVLRVLNDATAAKAELSAPVREFVRGTAWVATSVGRPSIQGNCPELVTKGHTTKRSDLYQCGLVLFHLYTGRHVLSSKDGENVVAVITSGLAGQRAKALNTKLGDVIAVLLRREPDYRFADATEAWQAIFSIVNPPR